MLKNLVVFSLQNKGNKISHIYNSLLESVSSLFSVVVAISSRIYVSSFDDRFKLSFCVTIRVRSVSRRLPQSYDGIY